MKLLKFQDLSDLGVVRTWTTLNKLIDDEGFPRGRILSRHRVWLELEVEDWIKDRQTDKLPPRGAVKRRATPEH